MTNKTVGCVLSLMTLLFSAEAAVAQTYTQMQWGMNKGVTPYQFGANINGAWTNLGTVSSAGVWSIPSSNLAFTATGTGAVTTTVSAKLNTMKSVKDFGAIGDNGAHPLSERYATLAAAQAVYPFVTSLTQTIDWAATQAATNYVTSTYPNRGTVYFPAGVYVMKDPIDCSSDAVAQLTYSGDPGLTYIWNRSSTPQTTFKCEGAVFKIYALKFQNLYIGYPTSSAAGSVAVSVKNRQETFFDSVYIGGYYNAIVFERSWAPRINNTYVKDSASDGVKALDNSMQGGSITNSTFTGNGTSSNEAAINLGGGGTGINITGNDFATNNRHIFFKYASAVLIHGNYFENSYISQPQAFFFDTGNTSISIVGNTIQWSTGNVFQNIDGLTFSDNHLYGSTFTTTSTAKQVRIAGNALITSTSPTIVSSIAAPTFETTSSPLVASSGFNGSKVQIQGKDALTLFSGYHSVQSPDGLGGSVFVGPTQNIYRNDTHTFQNKAWTTVFANLTATQFASNVPVRAGVYTISTLPTCSATILGAAAIVSDGKAYASSGDGSYGYAPVLATGAVTRHILCTNTGGATTYAWAYN